MSGAYDFISDAYDFTIDKYGLIPMISYAILDFIRASCDFIIDSYDFMNGCYGLIYDSYDSYVMHTTSYVMRVIS